MNRSRANKSVVRRSGFVPNPSLKLLDQCREVMRFHHLAYRTEQTYVDWIRRYVVHCKKGGVWRHPGECGREDVRGFLTHLASEGRVSAATQRQALNALVYLYREVVKVDLGDLGDFRRAKERKRLPVVLSRGECHRLFEAMEPPARGFAELLYGSGLRLTEGLRLRVKDVDLARCQIIVRSGKGDKDRVTVLPEKLRGMLGDQLAASRAVWRSDRDEGLAGVWMPEALERNYPKAGASPG